MTAQDLTTLSKFKAWYNLPATNTADDDMIDDLIDAASFDILAYIDRKSLLKNTYTEYLDGTGGPKIMLRQWPVLAVSSLYINGLIQTAAVQPNIGYFLDPWDGWPPGRPQFISMLGGSATGGNNCFGGAYFSRGVKNVQVTYTAGYAVQNEAATISASPYQVTAAQELGTWGQDDGVTHASTGVAFTKVTAAPTTGQYSVSGGVYTFAAADTGLAVYLNYSYVPFPLERACNKVVGEQYAYRQRIGQKAHTINGQTTASFDNSILTPPIIKKLQPFMRMVPY